MAKARHFFNYWVLDPFWGGIDYLTHLILRCLPLRMVSSLGAGIGSLAKHRFRKANGDAIANLKFFSPELTAAELKTHTDNMWCNIGRTLTEMAVLDRFDIQGHIKVSNVELFQNIDRNKPVIFLYPHLGNWELLALFIISLGFKLNIVYERLPNRFQRRLLESARRRSGYELISPDHQGIKKMYQALDAGETVGMAMDEFKHGRIIAPAFSERLPENSNIRYAVKMARRFGADIMSGYCTRELNDKMSFNIFVSEHICFTDPRFKEKSDAEIAEYINVSCQRWIREHADQWYMLHRARIINAAGTH